MCCCFAGSRDHRDLHVLTHAFLTRRSSGLRASQRPIPHTPLGQTADLVLVAPATARVIGLYAAGISEDLLTNTLIATRAPVLVCPAMHTEMWEHPAVPDNLRSLRSRDSKSVP